MIQANSFSSPMSMRNVPSGPIFATVQQHLDVPEGRQHQHPQRHQHAEGFEPTSPFTLAWPPVGATERSPHHLTAGRSTARRPPLRVGSPGGIAQQVAQPVEVDDDVFAGDSTV